MIEVIALILLAKEIGKLARRKGQPAGRWQFYLVIAWIACEFVSMLAAIRLLGVNDLITAFLFGIMGAFGGYLIVRSFLMRMPDLPADTFDFEKQE